MAVLNNKQFAVVAVAGGVLLLYLLGKSKQVAASVNPTSRENVFYQGVSSITPQNSLGSWLYDLFN